MNRRAFNGIAMLLATVGAVVALSTSATAAPAQAGAATGPSSSAADQRLATRLVNRFFTLLHDQDAAGLATFVSPAFQVQRPDGTGTDKAGYIADPPKVDACEVSGLVGTRAGDTVVARYVVTASETINGQLLKKDPAPRLSVFKKNTVSRSWQLVAHANFNAVPAAS